MKVVELRRHTDNDEDTLSDQGVADAHDIGTRLRPPYLLFVSTGANRARQTLEIWRAAVAGEATLEEELGLRSAREDEWRRAAKKAGGGDLRLIREADPDLVRSDSEVLGAALGRIFDRLADSGRALVVGHSPTNEAAVFGLTGELVDPIGKGDGVLIEQDADGFRVRPLD